MFGAFFLPPRDSYPRLTLGGACSAPLAEILGRFFGIYLIECGILEVWKEE